MPKACGSSALISSPLQLFVQNKWGLHHKVQAPKSKPKQSSLCHQFVKSNYFFANCGLGKDKGGNVVFNHNRFHFFHALFVAAIPTNNVCGPLVAGGHFFDVGLNLVWFGVVTVVAVEIGLLTPPFGLSAFVVKSSLDGSVPLSIGDVFRGTAPFTLMMAGVLVILMAFPSLSLVLLK